MCCVEHFISDYEAIQCASVYFDVPPSQNQAGDNKHIVNIVSFASRENF